jgi:hypothetical protein
VCGFVAAALINLAGYALARHLYNTLISAATLPSPSWSIPSPSPCGGGTAPADRTNTLPTNIDSRGDAMTPGAVP